MADIRITPVTDKSDLDTFIRVPDRIYTDDPNWVRPLKKERLDILDERRNPYFRHAEARYFIAWRDQHPVGRISAQIDRLALEHVGMGIGHFGFFETIEDLQVAAALFEAAEGWLKSKGMTRLQGPFSLSINEECGLLVDGFDTRPKIMMGHARPYYGTYLHELGFKKCRDTYAYYLDITKSMPERIRRIVAAGERNPRLQMRNIDTSDLGGEIERVMSIFNDAWSGNWGFIPFTDAEIAAAATSLKPLIMPHLVRICEVDGEPAAFMITLPDLNHLIRDLNGRLLPFGWTKLLWRLKFAYPEHMRVPLMGVRRKYQQSPIGACMAFLMIEKSRSAAARRGGMVGELSWILEDNAGMRNILEQIGSHIYKTYRIFEKPIQ